MRDDTNSEAQDVGTARAGPSVEDVLARVERLSGRDFSYRVMPGGLSHQVWFVQCGGSRYVLRVLDPAVSAVGLGIDPALEIENTVRAAGVGARVIDVLSDVPAMLLEYLPGRTLDSPDLHRRATLRRVALACQRLHAGPAFAGDFSILAKLSELLDVCQRHELPIPSDYRDRLSTVEAIGQALAVAPPPVVPCHNDLLAANFIDSGGEIRIVDYQLSGNNDPTFELGDIAAEAELDLDATAVLVGAYFGADVTPALRARTRLNLLLSNVTWTLWFSIHHGLLHRPGFDYWGEAGDKWRRARQDLDSPDLGRLMQVASGRFAGTVD